MKVWLPVTHLDASSGYATSLTSLRGSLMACQPACHMASECLPVPGRHDKDGFWSLACRMRAVAQGDGDMPFRGDAGRAPDPGNRRRLTCAEALPMTLACQTH